MSGLLGQIGSAMGSVLNAGANELNRQATALNDDINNYNLRVHHHNIDTVAAITCVALAALSIIVSVPICAALFLFLGLSAIHKRNQCEKDLQTLESALLPIHAMIEKISQKRIPLDFGMQYGIFRKTVQIDMSSFKF